MAPIQKLTGKQAVLFANVCHHFSFAAEMEDNDAPESVPLFGWLSPQQRLKLVSEVMVGVLCEKEPLPPNTIQHNATYRGLIEILLCEINIEIDMQQCHIGSGMKIGQDLLMVEEEVRDQRTPEEINQAKLEREIIEHTAEKNMKKMKRNKKKVGKFNVKEPASRTTNPRKHNENLEKFAEVVMKNIFSGPPVSLETRASLSKRQLTEYEADTFHWRRLVDDALQEDCSIPFPLSAVDFDWRCTNMIKWSTAIHVMLDKYVMEYANATERALIIGEVNEYTYADPQQLPRVRAIEKHVELLRKVYESIWDPMKLAIDQRRIVAVCSTVTDCYGCAHVTWLDAFVAECDEREVDFSNDGNYQVRLDIFQDLLDNYTEGLDVPFYTSEVNTKDKQEEWQPSKYSPRYTFEGVRCHGPGQPRMIGNRVIPSIGICSEKDNLKACSRCKVAVYCSAECQRLHWPEHEKNCAKLAKDDDQKMAQI